MSQSRPVGGRLAQLLEIAGDFTGRADEQVAGLPLGEVGQGVNRTPAGEGQLAGSRDPQQLRAISRVIAESPALTARAADS